MLIPSLFIRSKVAMPIFLIVCLFIFNGKSASAAPKLFIPNNSANSVSVIDGNSLKVEKTISVGKEPYGIAVSPDGRTVFVSNLAGDSVSIIDADKKEVIFTVGVGDAPFGVEVSSNGLLAYIVNAGSDTVSVVSVDQQKVVSTIPVGDSPHGIVRIKSRLYVTNYFSSSVSVIDTLSRRVIATIPVGAGPHGISANPSGDYLYVANVFDHTISVISASSKAVVKTIYTGKWPFSTVVAPSGKFLYASINGNKTVAVINTSTNVVEKNIFVGLGPHGISVDKSGSRIYVANEGSDSVVIIDAASLSPLTTIAGVMKPVAFGNFIANSSTMALPSGRQKFQYSPVFSPKPDTDPSLSEPFSIGLVSEGGNILTPRIQMDSFSGPVDIYLALQAPAVNPEILLLRPDQTFQPISAGLVPWKAGVTGPVDASIKGNIPMSSLPPAYFTIGVYVTPAGDMGNSYLWTTDFKGQYSIDSVTNTLVNSFSGDGAFDALVLAMDKGYSLRQIADAIMSYRLEANGNIKDYTGVVESPEDPPHNLIITSSSDAMKYTIEYFTLDDLRAAAREIGDGEVGDEIMAFYISNFTTRLTEVGYSLEEVTLAILSGTIRREQTGHGIDEDITYAIVDEEGNYIPPKKHKQGVFHDVDCIGFDFDGDGILDMCDPDDDNDGVYDSVDCATLDAGVFPGNPEICEDGIDQDCDGTADNMPCLCNPGKGFPQACGTYCIPAGAQCCDAFSGGYCETGYNCFYSPRVCCVEGSVPCPEGTGLCIKVGFEYQCPGADVRPHDFTSVSSQWRAFPDLQ